MTLLVISTVQMGNGLKGCLYVTVIMLSAKRPKTWMDQERSIRFIFINSKLENTILFNRTYRFVINLDYYVKNEMQINK